MASVSQKPASINFLRNMQSFIIDSSEDIVFKLMKGGNVLIEESYSPDADGKIEVDVRDVVAQELYLNLPSGNSFQQSNAVGEFTAYVDDSIVSTFKVIKGGVRKLSSASSFLSSNWLTWQPQTKQVTFDSPEYLTYYFSSSGSVTAKFYLKDGTTKSVTVGSGSGLTTFNVSFSRLLSLSGLSASNIYGIVDLSAGSSYTQRLICVPTMGDEHYYLAANSLGGIDTFCFHGDMSQAPNVSYKAAEKDGEKLNITVDPVNSWQQNTGYQGLTCSRWLWELLAAERAWVIMDGYAERIIIDSSSVNLSDRQNLTACTFKFQLAKDGGLLRIQRGASPAITLEVPSPSGEIFFLTARLNDFADAELSDDILFLVQSPYTHTWSKASLASITSWLKKSVTWLDAHSHENKSTLDKLGESEGSLTYDGKALQTKEDADNSYLRKDVDDTAHGTITFEKGAKFGEFVKGLLGKGGYIDGNGAAELDQLSIRHFLEVPELRYNRVSVLIGNRWNASGGGVIESVSIDTDAAGDQLMTGIITLHLEDGEFGTVAEDDICEGIFHDGMTLDNNSAEDFDDSKGNFKFSGFFTTYFRITEILDSKCSKFRYELRPQSDSWQHSFHPCEAMTFVCYGNFTNEERQVSYYATRTYLRFLKGVNDWEFTKEMIAAQFGNLSNLSDYGLAMTGYGGYLHNIYMSGTIQQFEEAELRLEIDHEGDNFLAFGETLHLKCRLWKGYYEDITDQVVTWSIKRDSGDATDDAAWLLKDKVKNFSGEIDISFTAEENDLGTLATNVSTLFTIVASTKESEAETTIVI
jgi:hypothetical protein